VKRAARALLPAGVLLFLGGLAVVVLGATAGHGSGLMIALGELVIFLAISCVIVGSLAWIITRH
jgi:hypothetical protein